MGKGMLNVSSFPPFLVDAGGNTMENEKCFTCVACRYTFVSDKEVERCPDCGKLQVRAATQDEVDAYIRVRKEIAQEENKQK